MTDNINTTKAPLVSICIPTYNGEKYLEEALISALNQTYQNIEIVISDDNAEKRLVGEAIKLISDNQKKKTLSENIAKMAERDADIRIAREVLKLIEK